MSDGGVKALLFLAGLQPLRVRCTSPGPPSRTPQSSVGIIPARSWEVLG